MEKNGVLSATAIIDLSHYAEKSWIFNDLRLPAVRPSARPQGMLSFIVKAALPACLQYFVNWRTARGKALTVCVEKCVVWA